MYTYIQKYINEVEFLLVFLPLSDGFDSFGRIIKETSYDGFFFSYLYAHIPTKKKK